MHRTECVIVTFKQRRWKMSDEKAVSMEEELKIAKEGYRFAEQHKDNWVAGVNRCPYGAASPKNHNVRAEAWYYGWWFYFYIVKPWIDVCRMQ